MIESGRPVVPPGVSSDIVQCASPEPVISTVVAIAEPQRNRRRGSSDSPSRSLKIIPIFYTKQLGEDPQTPYLQLTLQQVLEEVWTPRRPTRREQRHGSVREPRARHQHRRRNGRTAAKPPEFLRSPKCDRSIQ